MAPPLGQRGLVTGGANTAYEPMDAAEYMAWANENTLILCQALMDKKAWGDVAQIILNLENEPEETRLGILSYMEKILLQPIKGKPGQKHLRAWEIIEAEWSCIRKSGTCSSSGSNCSML